MAGATVVPSARAERRRIWHADSAGVLAYLVALGLLTFVLPALVLIARLA